MTDIAKIARVFHAAVALTTAQSDNNAEEMFMASADLWPQFAIELVTMTLTGAGNLSNGGNGAAQALMLAAKMINDNHLGISHQHLARALVILVSRLQEESGIEGVVEFSGAMREHSANNREANELAKAAINKVMGKQP